MGSPSPPPPPTPLLSPSSIFPMLQDAYSPEYYSTPPAPPTTSNVPACSLSRTPTPTPTPTPVPPFSPPTTVPPFSPPPTPTTSKGQLVGLIAGVVVAVILIAAAIFGTFLYRRRMKGNRIRETNNVGLEEQYFRDQKSPKETNPILSPAAEFTSSYPAPSASSSSGSDKPPSPHSPGMALRLSQTAFTYEELAMATRNFSSANLLGQGGFGYVHKGVLPNEREVAVKQLKAGSGQGEREFRAEMEVIGRVHHRHLVSLLGYCISGARKMLVYEFVPNNTLEFHLHGNGRPTMNWPTRMKIALGSAKGLAYLHEGCQPKIIHRDIKAANILLDHEFEAKVADFGLAKFSFDTETHVSTRVMGTFGYLAPEYAASGKLTEKSDVFSFGVVLLELITGRRPIHKTYSSEDDSIVEWARPVLVQALDDGSFDGLVDTKLQSCYNSDEMTRMVACAAACVRHSARLRPRMSQILRALEGNTPLDDLNEGIKPGHRTIYGSFGSQGYDTSQYNKDMKNFIKLALESQELGTTGYSGHSTESGGPHPSTSSTSESQQTTVEIELEKIKKHTKSR